MRQFSYSSYSKKTFLSLLLAGLVFGSTNADTPEPPGLYVTTDGNRVSLIWNAVPNATGYELYYAPYPEATTILSLDLGSSTIISQELPDGSAYYVALKSYNDDGTSDYSNVEHFIVTGGPAEIPQIAYSFGESMDSSARSAIRIAASRTEAFYASQSLSQFQPTAVVHAYDDYEELLDAYIATFTPSVASSLGLIIRSTGLTRSDADESLGNGSSQGQAIGNDFFINASNTYWRSEASEVHKARVVAHELFHVLQYQLVEGPMFAGPNTAVPLAGPRWLLEGSASLVGYMMLDWAGLSDFDSDLQLAIDDAGRTEYLLEEMENSPGMYSTEAPFRIALTATAFLSRDLSKYITFFSSISSDVTWEEAFIQAFGRDKDTFYAEFNAYVDNGYQ